jgi:hypothetical protein
MLVVSCRNIPVTGIQLAGYCILPRMKGCSSAIDA